MSSMRLTPSHGSETAHSALREDNATPGFAARAGLLGIGFLALATAATASAQTASHRSGNWEATIQLVANDSGSVNAEQQSKVEYDSAVGLGFGVAYNFDNNWALGFNLNWIEPDYKATLEDEDGELVKVDHKMTISSGQFAGVWNIMDGPFTPYLQAAMGWTYVDSNVSKTPPVTGCWWDPFWGYVCQNYYNTYDETSFSYGFGAGLRYEFNNGMFLKGSINRLYIDSNDFDPEVDTARLELGWLFR
ncbi:MAG: porin family protein [Pseudomonadales bacterium]|nr:porin family protein [Pseudomonadales bacterium]MCP5189318.1 porin family protein [Pseudomonadales bacterium]MCP5204423.1 porin family protein [Pseudomonadales bacterium]